MTQVSVTNFVAESLRLGQALRLFGLIRFLLSLFGSVDWSDPEQATRAVVEAWRKLTEFIARAGAAGVGFARDFQVLGDDVAVYNASVPQAISSKLQTYLRRQRGEVVTNDIPYAVPDSIDVDRWSRWVEFGFQVFRMILDVLNRPRDVEGMDFEVSGAIIARVTGGEIASAPGNLGAVGDETDSVDTLGT